MKKIKNVFVFVFIAIAVLSLIGCTSPKQIDRYFNKMQKADSATIVVEMQVPIFGKMIMTMKVDGNKGYSSAIFDDVETYTEIIGDKTYTYTQNIFGKWEKTESITEEDAGSAGEQFEELFNSYNYEYSKDIEKFTIKEGVYPVFLNEMVADSVTLEINGNTCIISGEVNIEGMVMPFSITIKDLNDTTVTLPTIP